MKIRARIVLFIILKLFEISALIFIPYLIGTMKWTEYMLSNYPNMNFFMYWFRGFWHLGAIFMIICMSFFIITPIKMWIDCNYELTKKIIK